MLKPSYFNGKADKVLSYYQELEDYLLQDIAGFLIEAGTVGGKADRELFVLQQMGMNNAEISKRLSKLSGKSQNAVRELLMDSVMTSFSNDQAVLNKYFKGEFGPLDKPTIKEVMEAEWIKTNGELDNLTRTTMMQYNSDLIRLMNDAEIRVATGNQSYTSAIIEVLDNYAKTGMIIDYPTGAARSLEAAVRCCVVTSMNQTAAQVTNQYIAEGGIEYVLVTAHEGARYSKKGGIYSHAGWQGKVYKIVGSEPGFPNLTEATGYSINPITGEGKVANPAGLHGYNCRHSHQPWDKDLKNPWIDDNGKPLVDPDESKEVYEAQQEQRSLERGIRETKRRLQMKQTEIDSIEDPALKDKLQMDYDSLAYKLRMQNAKYNDFCSEKNLVKQSDRLKAPGFNAADARKANGRATIFSRGETENANKGIADTRLNKEVIDSPKYKNAINTLGEDDITSKKILEEMRTTLYHRAGTEFEDLTFINSITHTEKSCRTFDKIRECKPSKEMLLMLDKNKGKIIAIHNHPYSAPPSANDAALCLARHYKYGIIACHNGHIYKYSAVGDFNEVIYAGAYAAAEKKGFTEEALTKFSRSVLHAGIKFEVIL